MKITLSQKDIAKRMCSWANTVHGRHPAVILSGNAEDGTLICVLDFEPMPGDPPAPSVPTPLSTAPFDLPPDPPLDLVQRVLSGTATQKDIIAWRRFGVPAEIDGWAPCHEKLGRKPKPWPEARRVRWHATLMDGTGRSLGPLGLCRTNDGDLGPIDVRRREYGDNEPWIVVCQGIEVAMAGKKSDAYKYVEAHLRNPVTRNRRPVRPPRRT